MKHLVLGGLLFLAACSAQQQAVVSKACGDIASLPAVVTAALDAQDPHSALGVLWADAKSGCANGAPVQAVNQGWTQQVWGEVKALLPQVLPTLVPLLIGLL